MNTSCPSTQRYAIIGGGISGLSIANLLKNDHKVTIFVAICFIAQAAMYSTQSDKM